MTRYICENGSIRDDLLSRKQLRDWVDGLDPLTGERRGRDLESPVADLVLDATVNAPKSFSIAAMLDPELNAAFEDLQDRLRDRIIHLWQNELNARRGKGGLIREDLARVEVVELKHERSRSLDPHKHRHLWLNVKVQGQDGKWSNLDTRVALRFQNAVNAEGDLAARTDPAWVRALAAKGYTLSKEGEIEQLAHLVRPLSKRSAQIETNRAGRLEWWRSQHPGEEASRDVLNQIDRWAWATGRPDKPHELDEDDWAGQVRAEVMAADPAMSRPRPAVTVAATAIADIDLDLVAARAVVDADDRSTGTGGRFSVFDVRAGVLRALSGTGVVKDRQVLDRLVADLVARAVSAHTIRLLEDEVVPNHVKHLVATQTAVAKNTLAHQLELLPTTGGPAPAAAITQIAAVVSPDKTLDEGQLAGASTIAGTSSLVTIIGAAGTGKTTMLKAAAAALHLQRRRMVVVAPTKKAATIAGRETGADASSLHQLLHAYGWRWAEDDAGRTTWTRLSMGDLDPATGHTYTGPGDKAVRRGDRIVVDEAGMLDLDTANALVALGHETGAGLAAVGDPNQALPVGHSGAMELMRRNTGFNVELTDIHRFKDPAWAELTREIRDAHGARERDQIAARLVEGGHVKLVNNSHDALHAMVDGWFDATKSRATISLVTATHAEAQAIGEAIQARRIQEGSLNTDRIATGQGGQTLFEGDAVQTRRNDSRAGVENRQNWIVSRIRNDSILLTSTSDSSQARQISHEYAAGHLHLGYASTVYGAQGETTDRSIVGPEVDAAGLYVGLTRGRHDNSAVLVAATARAATAELADILRRETPEPGLDDSLHVAWAELHKSATQASLANQGRSPDETRASTASALGL
ncbi:AAA family ATPase [Planctomonas sp. JC2975]|uniref:AAA family ATPase n=1 Tax=Planctomonas sp. JC2975 TaxID=2729626 RepID=UPI001F11194E|nr:AAA family ATPase [Planctomonas sp. JC2975]